MDKMVFVTGDVKDRIEGRKAALLRFGVGSGVILPTVKSFGSQEGKKGFEQLKRYVSSEAFEVIVLDGFALALKDDEIKEITIWLNDHATAPGFPQLLFLGEGRERFSELKAVTL